MAEHYRTSIRSDIDYLLAHMRPEDVAECLGGGSSPNEALAYGFMASTRCLTLIEPGNGAPAAMLGVTPSEYDCAGKIWLLGTSAIERYPMTFLRHSREVLGQLYGRYTLLYNFTFVENEMHHRWLKWLGFVFLRKVELTPDKFFYEFVRPKAEPILDERA